MGDRNNELFFNNPKKQKINRQKQLDKDLFLLREWLNRQKVAVEFYDYTKGYSELFTAINAHYEVYARIEKRLQHNETDELINDFLLFKEDDVILNLVLACHLGIKRVELGGYKDLEAFYDQSVKERLDLCIEAMRSKEIIASKYPY